MPPGEDPLGIPYGEWGARWWEWLAGVPAAGDPGLNDNCQANQGGEVFFIPHTWPGTSFETNCEIGADQRVLASAGGILSTNSEGETDEELLAGVESEKPVLSNLSVMMDGVEVPDIDSYWVTSALFDLVAIEDSILGVEAGTQVRSAVGGWFVMIPPLEPGSHTIVVKDDIDDPTSEDPPSTAELTAHVTVSE